MALAYLESVKEGTMLSLVPKDVLFLLSDFLLTVDYYRNGRIRYKRFIVPNNSLFKTVDGESIMFYPNGNVETRWFHVNDELHGEISTYFKNGQVWRVSMFDSGKMQREIHYSKKGRVYREWVRKSDD
jgi:antitoxin component YwqK of YwqJK toxin-antitoxin module